MAKSHLFAHLLKHACAHRAALVNALKLHHQAPSKATEAMACAEFGALDCLYWQALGCDEVLLARKIARTLEYTPKHGSPLMAQNTEARTPVK